MAHARISANLPPNIDPTKAPLAFGRRALPKLKEELCSTELLTQQQALMSLCDLVHNPEIVYQALEIGFLDNLKALLVHHDSTVRQKTTEILCVTAMHSVGRQGLIRQGVIPALTELLDDPVDICRKNTHQILEMMAKLPEGAADILHAALIPSLLLKLKTELDEIQELILDTLSSCLHLEASEALASGAVTILKEKLTHPSVAIRSKAAQVLLAAGTHPEGKSLICEEVVAALVSLLEDTDPEVQASAAGALMFATVKPQGRFSALGAGAIAPLLRLATEQSSRARLSALKALTMLAELPQGRTTLLDHTAMLEQCLSDPCEAVRRAATTAISVIRWKPC
ncbi:radial spoke head 14 homolog [Dryobates pubescens]|uniref:radial spoke head 14 homolog n=1 Tax=Dryobates pubescens TaxID=118200 RepID=UPI0023B9CA2A|nr:radial spoke head 14 homolog [Dryobates pubescens]